MCANGFQIVFGNMSGVVNAVGSVRFSDADVHRLFELYRYYLAHPYLSKVEFSDSPYRSEPDPQVKLDLEGVAKRLVAWCADGRLPAFATHICNHRDLFLDTAIGLSDDDDRPPKQVFMPIMPKQSPKSVTWLRFDRREPWSWIFDEHRDDLEDRFVSYQNSRQFVNDSASLGFDGDDRLVVLPHVTFRGGGLLLSLQNGIPYDDFIAHHPPLAVPRAPRDYSGRAGEVRAAVRDKLIDSMPWLTIAAFDIIYAKFLDEEEKPGGVEPPKQPAAPRVVPDLDADDVHARLMDDLREARERWDDDASDYTTNFYHWLLGGNWTGHVVGVAYDRCAVKSRASAFEFTDAFSWTSQKSYSLHAYGGELNAVMLAKGCCHRAHFFMEQWQSAGQPADFDFRVVVHEYEEDEAWLDWASGLDIESAAFGEMCKIRSFFPEST
jgi:hypothetical protein